MGTYTKSEGGGGGGGGGKLIKGLEVLEKLLLTVPWGCHKDLGARGFSLASTCISMHLRV